MGLSNCSVDSLETCWWVLTCSLFALTKSPQAMHISILPQMLLLASSQSKNKYRCLRVKMLFSQTRFHSTFSLLVMHK